MFGLSWLTTKLASYGAVVLAVLAVVARIFFMGKTAGKLESKAKEAKARDENLARIKRAADARPTKDVQSDPNNRDNRV